MARSANLGFLAATQDDDAVVSPNGNVFCQFGSDLREDSDLTHSVGVQSQWIRVRNVHHAHTDVITKIQISQCVGHGLDTL